MPKDMRIKMFSMEWTLLFKDDCLWHYVGHIIFMNRSQAKVLNARYEKQWLLGFSWQIMPQVFLERATPWRTADNHRDSPSWGNSVQLRDWSCQPAEQHFTETVRWSLFVFSAHVIYTMLFFVTVFVFIIECQLVLMRPPVLSQPWLILWLWWEWWHHVFLPLGIYSQFVVFTW